MVSEKTEEDLSDLPSVPCLLSSVFCLLSPFFLQFLDRFTSMIKGLEVV